MVILTEKEISDIAEITALLVKVNSPEVTGVIKGYLMAMDYMEAIKKEELEKKGA